MIDPQLISYVIEVPILPVSGVPFPTGDEAPSIDFLHDFFGRRHSERTSLTPISTSVLLFLCTDF
jgi:hypothetical protein